MPKANKNGKRYPKLVAKVTQNDRSVLDWMVASLEYGRVFARRPLPGMGTTHDAVFSYRQARSFLLVLEPYLKVKQAKVSGLLDRFGRMY